ncbi:MAG TPA: hypothetical protein PLO62_04105 [Candidatus Hydrogenedentes bacterium]|nr:hypothetical protein [Candidatus Hydrogenedentota bacterium]HOS03027.1 hypothetical protein [Candidatus Hydrogenedentota bacterium]
MNLNIVWRTVTEELPALVARLNEHVGKNDSVD